MDIGSTNADSRLRPSARRGSYDGALFGSISRAALYGIAWGGAARLWMRYISEDPEFSVTGTSFIIGMPTIVCLFSVLAARCVRWRGLARVPTRAVAGFSTVLLGMGAGVLMLPSLVLGGVVWANRDRSPRPFLIPRHLLVLLTLLASAPIVVVAQEIPEGGRFLLAFPAYLLLVATFIPVYARIYHPARNGPPS